MKRNILKLQDLYLKTNEERYLNELYNQLQKLGYTIVLQKHTLSICESDKLDMVDEIVASIILRLHETKTKIITHPSGFLSRAIYFRSYTYGKKREDLNYFYLEDDNEVEDTYHLEDVFFNKEITDEFYQFLEETVEFYSSGLSKEEHILLRKEVIGCFLLGRPYERYIYKLKKNLEAPFISIFEELKNYYRKCFPTVDILVDGKENEEIM